MPTPKQHMIVAMRVAYGTLAIQSLHMFPGEENLFIVFTSYYNQDLNIQKHIISNKYSIVQLSRLHSFFFVQKNATVVT